MGKAKQEHNFEDKLQLLEGIVSQLEDGELGLDNSLQAFEQGVKLLQDCQKILTEAEQKVQLLTEQQGSPHTESMPEPAAE